MALLLHLSDLHLANEGRAETAFGQISDDLAGEQRIERLDYVIISGDSTDHASPDEYGAAQVFVDQLCDGFEVPRERLLIVPGNHDVDWTKSKDLYRPERADAVPQRTVSQYQDPENKRYVEVVTDADAYKQRFANFAEYHLATTEREYPLDYEKQIDAIEAGDGSIVLLGLNSAWNLDHYHRDRSSIMQTALNRGLRAAQSRGDDGALRIVVWHHPWQGEAALADTAFFQRLVVNDFVIALHGHVHKPQTEQFQYEQSIEGRRLHVLGAGTLDSPDVHRGYPWQYNLLSTEDGRVRLTGRGREERDGAWRPAARFLVGKGKPPTDTITLELAQPEKPSPTIIGGTVDPPQDHHQAPIRSLDELKAYLKAQRLDATGYRIAVEALIFDANGRLLLQERGIDARDEVGKLEGVGGTAFSDQLLDCIHHYVREEIGASVKVQVDELLEVRPSRFVERDEPADWVVVSYLCRLVEGEPEVVDSSKTASLHWLALAELHARPDGDLSRSTSRARDLYRAKYRTTPYFSQAGPAA
jgi:3',5'-cyclic AMP phosphodiesterase CpdA/ADP-ribose pyrophosphatase YjhB (NUDIX family)